MTSNLEVAMSQFTIYHNPRCSKSRQTLQLLQDNGVEPRVIEYLKTPPSAADVLSIAASLEQTGQRDTPHQRRRIQTIESSKLHWRRCGARSSGR